LLLAEPGSGEELCARFLHRMNTPWIAAEDRVGAPEGSALPVIGPDATLFLRQVDQWTPDRQRAWFARLGPLAKSGTRIVATAQPDLAERVAQGGFDARLYSLLSNVTLRVPPLREHADDVPEIATTLLARMVEAREVPVRSFTTSALNVLRLHSWPGNLSQLEAVVKSAALVAGGGDIGPSDVASVLGEQVQANPPMLGGLPIDGELREARDAFERAYFEYHIAREGGNMSRVAERVGLERTHLYRKLKQLGIVLPRRQDS
jgi:DNA-binding NtrC family response regulator